jgi:hypothetical protein
MLYDLLGGAVCVAGVVVFGITRPPALVSGFQSSPLLAWLALGALGPLVSAGVIDRFPLRAVADVVSRSDRSGRPDAATPTVFSDVRFQASQRIIYALYDDVRVSEIVEHKALRLTARGLIEAGLLDFDIIEREIRLFARQYRWRLPQPLLAAFKARSAWPTGHDPGRETIQLVDVSMELGFVRALDIVCRAATATQPSAAETPAELVEVAVTDSD